jgi:hypothetical protein
MAVSTTAKQSKLKSVTLVHLYPREMNIYGDTGNVKTLLWRLRRHGFDPRLKSVSVGEKIPSAADIIVCGGGQDSGQLLVQADLAKQAHTLQAMVKDGIVLLSVCGTYQLFGEYFQTNKEERIRGISLFDAYTVAGQERLIGNVVVSSPFGHLVGFENHSGRTILREGQLPLGRVIKGFGNDGQSSKEGAVTHNAFGTYLHGPILPKNPQFADELIARAVDRRYGLSLERGKIDDALAKKAAQIASKRP